MVAKKIETIKVYKDTKIFIACPAFIKTGGTELLHQLAHELSIKYDCYIYYFDSNHKCPTDGAFKKYNVNFVKVIDTKDNCKNNILIVPETYTDLLYKFKKMRRAIWWLSVDNYFLKTNKVNVNHLEAIIFKIMNVLSKEYFDFGIEKNKITHIAQSYYAVNYLKKHKIKNILYLSDYINSIYFERMEQRDRENIVLYNPKKGIEFTRKIIAYNKEIKYVPLINLSNDQIKDLLDRSKVYIDFGEHPGKDRFPREAAVSGCCVITGIKGAARFKRDIPINEEFKFQDKEENIPQIIDRIKNCLENYQTNNVKFNQYRNMIRNEESKFKKDIAKIFKSCC